VAPARLILGLLPGMVERGDGHVVNVLTWGVQVKAPKFAAYIASKTALDTFSRIAGREFYGDHITFTNVRLPLVRTDMIGPTEAYRRSPALSPEQAAGTVVRALEDRPLTVNTLVGTVSEVLNLMAPRLSDAVSHAAAKRFPDSPAARRHVHAAEGGESNARTAG
jgi:short-subunit dehydrogenase